ncbi:hypothetical protein FHR37_005147 [Actinopolymorpha cephalotaxi]|uniref:Uncharacterized protein n=1 Tax=Actinopolymorpha cephalotaxi TaxID=504797 RepID=A0ABX2SDP3_9ACTN|nr:hypothetical protein [Actinopolymorpha cephalotaxi]
MAAMRNPAGQLCLALFATELVLVDDELCR